MGWGLEMVTPRRVITGLVSFTAGFVSAMVAVQLVVWVVVR